MTAKARMKYVIRPTSCRSKYIVLDIKRSNPIPAAPAAAPIATAFEKFSSKRRNVQDSR